MRRFSILYLVSISIIILLLMSCANKKQEQVKTAAVPVKTAAVERRALSIPVFTSGKLFPKAMIKLAFKVGGIIDRIYVDEGETVKKGQLLAVLDLAEIDAHCTQAENAFQKAKRDLERVKNLYDDRAATLEQLQNVKTAFAIAESNLKIAKFNLAHSRIKAPARGKILKRLYETGEMVGVGMPLLLFGSTEENWVIKAGVSERDIIRLQMADKAAVRFDAYPGKDFTGAVTEISQAMDPASGTYEVEIAVESEGLKLAAGFTARVRIEPASTGTFYVIPVDAVVAGEGMAGIVFTVKDNKAVKIEIEAAHIFPETVAVSRGLEDTTVVVTAGAAYLSDGAEVEVVQ